MSAPLATMTLFEALEALRAAPGWTKRAPSRPRIAAHAKAHPWTRKGYEHVAMGLWATRGEQGVGMVALFANGLYDYELDPLPFGAESTFDDDSRALVNWWLPLTREGRPAPVVAATTEPAPVPAWPGWEGPLDPSTNLHNACRYFTNWSITAQAGVHHALRRKGLPDVRVATLAEVATLTRAELLRSYGIGPGTVRFVAGALDRAGLEFAPDVPLDAASDEDLMDMLPTRSRKGTR